MQGFALEFDDRESWMSATLQRLMRHELGSPGVMVVSNREPYVHDRDTDGRRHVQVPVSGVVTGVGAFACARLLQVTH